MLENEKIDINSALRCLSDREITFVKMYYYERATLREVGDCFGIRAERVRQIIGRAHRKLREFFRRDGRTTFA